MQDPRDLIPGVRDHWGIPGFLGTSGILGFYGSGTGSQICCQVSLARSSVKAVRPHELPRCDRPEEKNIDPSYFFPY